VASPAILKVYVPVSDIIGSSVPNKPKLAVNNKKKSHSAAAPQNTSRPMHKRSIHHTSYETALINNFA
jgi:hypothetical protein